MMGMACRLIGSKWVESLWQVATGSLVNSYTVNCGGDGDIEKEGLNTQIDSKLKDSAVLWTRDSFKSALDDPYCFGVVGVDCSDGDLVKTNGTSGYWILGSFVGDQLVGFVIVHIVSGEAEIHNLAVVSSFKGQGIGTLLVNEVVRICKQLQVEQIFLEVRATNHCARHIYKKCGFIECARRPNYYHVKSSEIGRADSAESMAIIMVKC
jgi:ribosomal-protein-alanine acetyltransferase